MSTVPQDVEDVALARWLVIGPFDGRGEDALDTPQPPEGALDQNATYDGTTGPVKWQGWSREDGGSGVVRLGEHLGEAGDAVGYASALVYCRRRLEGLLLVSTSGSAAGFVNRERVFREDHAGGPGPLEVRCPGVLEHGWNWILLKFLFRRAEVPWFCAGLAEATGQPLGDIRVHATLFGKGPNDSNQAIETGSPATEWRRSSPDSVVYLPTEGDVNDGDNEHFLVFESPNGMGLLAMWTQSTVEAHGDNHIVLARSEDGVNWSEPEWIIGTRANTRETQASWGFPVAARSGRIYCFYQKSEQGVRGGGNSNTMGGLSSDDDGRTWWEGPDIQVPTGRLDRWDAGSEQSGFIVWQNPTRDSKGRWVAGYTAGGLGFMRFDNIDEGPDIEDLEITWLPVSGHLVYLPRYVDRSHHCGEPSVVLLPDGRLFTAMRTTTGYIWYSVSENDGEEWRDPEVLRYVDNGEPVRHPLAPCPIYTLRDGRYLLLYHNNDYWAAAQASGAPIPTGMGVFTHRRPAFIAVGEFRPQAHQPVWFSQPRQFLDNDGVIVSSKTSDEMATYTSFTDYRGKQTLWYPDRKYYLLGKHVSDEVLAEMIVDQCR